MPYTEQGSPHIYFEIDEEASHEPIVFIEGLGTQMVGWRTPFLDLFRARGFRVIRLDNRDIGLSDKLGEPGDADRRYSIADMAQDVVRVLDATGLRSAHVVGQSMGGAIAQSMAIHSPERVRSLALVYTAPDFSGPYWGEAVEARRAMPQLAPDVSRDDAIAYRLAGERMCTPEHLHFDEAAAREIAERSWARCPRSDGADRQLSALRETADHTSRLHELRMPVTIIHGRDDPLIRPDASVALAGLIPQADLHLYSKMGHVVVPRLWREFVNIIARNASVSL